MRRKTLVMLVSVAVMFVLDYGTTAYVVRSGLGLELNPIYAMISFEHGLIIGFTVVGSLFWLALKDIECERIVFITSAVIVAVRSFAVVNNLMVAV